MPPAGDAAFDADGLRENLDVRASNEKRRDAERAAKAEHAAKLAALCADVRDGRLGMAEFARVAREAGMPAADVAAALRDRQNARVDLAAVSRGDAAAVARGFAEADAAADAPAPTRADELAASGGEMAQALDAKAEGVELLRRGDVAEAERAFGRAAALGEGAEAALASAGSGEAAVRGAADLVVAARLNESLCQLKLEQWADAAATCSGVLARQPQSAKALYRRAQARRRLGHDADARDDLRKAARAAPKDHEIRRALADAEAALAPPAPAPPPPAADAADAPSAADPAARTYCFLDVSIDGEPGTSRLSFELFDDLVPRTAANFRALCNGVEVGGRTLRYAGAPFHRLVKGFVLQGGDVAAGDGSGAESSYGGTFADESLAPAHGRPGVLSMANCGPDTNGSQFFVTLNPAPQLDGRHVAFGRLLSGMAALREIERLPVDAADRPRRAVLIVASGELDPADAVADGADEVDEGSGAAAGDDARAGGGLDMGGEAMVVAAARGDVRMVAELVRHGVPVDAYGSSAVVDTAAAQPGKAIECTALHCAARVADAALVGALLAHGAAPSLEDSAGRTPLMLAAEVGAAPCVRLLLDAKAPPGHCSSDGRGAVHLAASRGAAECLALLLAADNTLATAAAGGGGGNAGVTPLHLAAAADRPACVAALLAAGAQPASLAAGALSAVHLAAGNGALGALAALLGARADADARGGDGGRTPLLSACEGGQAEAVAALLAARADPAAADAHGSAALHWAAKGAAARPRGDDAASRIVAALLAAGADAAARTRDGSTALHVACEAAAPRCAALLLDKGADADAPNVNGLRPLHAASAAGSAECAALLLDARADAGAAFTIRGKHALSADKESDTKTALYLCAERGHADVARLLLGRGADADAPAVMTTPHATTRTSALWAARRGGHDAVAELLVAAGAVERATLDQPDASADGTNDGIARSLPGLSEP